jgi:hypothetical protein
MAKKHSEDLREYEPSLENMRKLTLGRLFNKELVTEELVREHYEMSIGKTTSSTATAECLTSKAGVRATGSTAGQTVAAIGQ